MKRKIFIVLLFVSFTAVKSGAQTAIDITNADLLHRAEKALTRVIVHDIFSPPVASRIYLYANFAAYEAVVPSQKKYKSLHNLVSFFSTHYSWQRTKIEL